MDLLHPLVKVKRIYMRKHRIVGIKSCILGFFHGKNMCLSNTKIEAGAVCVSGHTTQAHVDAV